MGYPNDHNDRRFRLPAASALAALLALTLTLPAAALTLTRGPYLQVGTSTQQIVRWRTDVATDSRVRYGLAPNDLTAVADVATATTEHEVKLTGLAPGTVYYYAVGTAAGGMLAGGDANHFFTTAPVPGIAKATRIWALGDAGTANSNQAAVRDAYASWNGSRYTDLILMLGDNAYNSGTDAEYQAAVFAMYPDFLRQTNVWSTIGNHETNQATNPDITTVPYFSIFTLPVAGEAGGRPSGTEKYYSFDYANIHFICLDSMTSDRTPTGPMLTWLEADLAANTQPWIIAFWHHPPYTKGSHDSDTEQQLIDMRTNALPILEKYGVDLVLAGHSHSYERSKLVGGHYGLSTTLTAAMIKDGGSGRPAETGAYIKQTDPYRAVYAVAGSAGKTSGGTLNHPVMYISLNNLGSMVVDVNGDRLDATFLRETGAVADTFTIDKTPAPNVAPAVALTSPADGSTYTAPASVALAATPTDTDGTVVKVEFYDGATPLATLTAAPWTYAWTGVTAGSHVLTAKATDDDGATTTSASVTITVQDPPPTPPAAPTSLTARAVSRSQINLAWTDNAGNETGFKIERSTDLRTWTQITTVGANVTTYASTGLTANKTYYYRIRATNASGDSAYSNTASARTPKR